MTNHQFEDPAPPAATKGTLEDLARAAKWIRDGGKERSTSINAFARKDYDPFAMKDSAAAAEKKLATLGFYNNRDAAAAAAAGGGGGGGGGDSFSPLTLPPQANPKAGRVFSYKGGKRKRRKTRRKRHRRRRKRCKTRRRIRRRRRKSRKR